MATLTLEPHAVLRLSWDGVPTQEQVDAARAIPGARAVQGGYEWGWWPETAGAVINRLNARWETSPWQVGAPLFGDEGWTWVDPDRVAAVEWRSPTSPRPHQLAFKAWRRGGGRDGLYHPGCLLEAGLGCIAGSAIVHVSCAGKGFPLTIAELYTRFHRGRLPRYGGHQWDPGIPMKVRALVDGELRQHDLVDVLDKGVQDTVRVWFESGRALQCTPDHEIMTPSGWQAARNLCGQQVLVNGKFIDDDGYVRVWMPNHPRWPEQYAYEHVLVMEAHLGRSILWPEQVHHKNENRSDNRVENLEVLTSSEHHKAHRSWRRLHGSHGGKGGEVTFLPHVDRVVAIEPAGPVRVYDLVMASPHHNFVADGVVVHNCGKTLSAIEEMLELLVHRPQARILVLARNSLLETTWGPQLEQHAAGLPYLLLNGPRSQRVIRLRALAGTRTTYPIVCVHSYEDLPGATKDGGSMGKVLASLDWDMIVVDETAAFRTAGAQRTGRLTGYQARPLTAPYRLGLSGLPMVKQATDLYPGLRWLGAPVGNKGQFMERFMKLNPYTQELSLGDADGLRSLLDCWRFQVPKSAVLRIPRAWHYERIDLKPWQKALYRKIQKQLRDVDAEEFLGSRLEELLALAKVTAGFDGDHYRADNAKLEHLTAKILPEIGEDQAIIWVRFREEAFGVSDALRGAGYSALPYTGAQSDDMNRAAYDHFTEGGTQFFVSTLAKGAIGLNLPQASAMVYQTRDFDTEGYLQSLERNARLTTTHAALNVVVIEADNTIDQKITQILGDDAHAAAQLTALDIHEVLGGR